MGHRLTDREWVRYEAELMGLDLSDSDVEAVLAKWGSDPACPLAALLQGIRNLSEKQRRESLREWNRKFARLAV
jgi:hypothetical protein